MMRVFMMCITVVALALTLLHPAASVVSACAILWLGWDHTIAHREAMARHDVRQQIDAALQDYVERLSKVESTVSALSLQLGLRGSSKS